MPTYKTTLNFIKYTKMSNNTDEEKRTKALHIADVMSRFNVKQEDIYKINGIIRKHIEDATSSFYSNIEDEKNHIRNTLYEIVNVAYNGS